jgi:hypothetical protein
MRLLRLIALFVAGLAVLPLFAQEVQSTAARGEYRIAGVVVSSIDSHPLQHATVDLLDPGSETRPVFQTTTSDEFGHFAFPNVPAGNHILKGESRNYLPTEYDEHEEFTTGIVTGAGVDTESLVLRLRPESSIAGTVRDETNDAVPNATVRLFSQSPGAGDGRLDNAGVANTDDRGRFEFSRLQPGKYFLVITARPWYAINPDLSQAEGNAGSDRLQNPVRRVPSPVGIAASIDPSLDVAYPVHFYPGTTDPKAATPIVLRGGGSLDLSFTLSPVQAVTLTLPVASGKGVQQQFPQLMVSFHGQSVPIESQSRQANGQISFVGLAPGDYMLSKPHDSAVLTNLGTPIHLDRNISLADLPPVPAVAHIHVVFRSADGSPLPAQLRLGLIRSQSTEEVFESANPKGEVVLDAAPGNYYFSVDANGLPLFVGQVVAGERTLSTNQIHVAADESDTFSLLVRRGTHVLSGIARKEGKPCAGAFVLIFPSNQVGNIDNASRDESNLDGSFQLSGLAPGAYTLLAIDGGWDVAWNRPEVLARYLAKALTIHVADTAEKSQRLQEPLLVQPYSAAP